MTLNSRADLWYFGCPSVCSLPTGPRCTTPRQLDSPIAQFAKNTIRNFPNKSLKTAGENQLTKNWLAINPENLGPALSLLQNLPFPTHYRSCGIAPTRLNQTVPPDDLFDAPEAEPEQISSEDVWRPDCESSTQFLFDLFLRWLHFTSLKSPESPHRRVLISACRALNLVISGYRSRQHFYDTSAAIQNILGFSPGNSLRNDDPLLLRILTPLLSQCCAVAGFEGKVYKRYFAIFLNNCEINFLTEEVFL